MEKGTKNVSKVEFSGNTHIFKEAVGEAADPQEYFHYFFSPGLLHYIVNETNKYALEKNGKELKVTYDELEQFLGIVLYMGIVRTHGVRDYWKNETRIPQVANVMSRNRFQDIARNLHFVDNNAVSSNEKESKLWKIDPILQVLRRKCNDLPVQQHNSVDEMMVAYKGKTSKIRQYLPKKPKNGALKFGQDVALVEFCKISSFIKKKRDEKNRKTWCAGSDCL